MVWVGWPLARIVILFVAFAYIFIGIQVTMSHYRQNFHQKIMLVPVLSSPFYVLFAAAYALFNLQWYGWIFAFLMWIAAISGLIGFYYHFKGVGVRVGGYAGRNFLIDPPVIMPLMYSAMGVLGLLAYYWR